MKVEDLMYPFDWSMCVLFGVRRCHDRLCIVILYVNLSMWGVDVAICPGCCGGILCNLGLDVWLAKKCFYSDCPYTGHNENLVFV